MENINLDATSNTPAVKFESSGKLIIKGRSMPANVSVFYSPLIEWVKLLNVETVVIDIKLDYMSSTSSKKLLEILKILDSNNNIRELNINWYYEVDDEDTLEKGQIYEEILRKASFRYCELSESG